MPEKRGEQGLEEEGTGLVASSPQALRLASRQGWQILGADSAYFPQNPQKHFLGVGGGAERAQETRWQVSLSSEQPGVVG